MAAYTVPKIWRPGEPFTPEDFNTFVKSNYEALLDRPTHGFFTVSGGSDVSFTNTSLAAHGNVADTIVTLHPHAQSLAVFNIMCVARVGGAANRIIAVDIYWQEKDLFLSTMTNTPATNGLQNWRMGDINQNLGFGLTWFQPDIPEGSWNFQIYNRVSADTANEERSDAAFAFSGHVF